MRCGTGFAPRERNLGLSILEIADLQAPQDDPVIIRSLLAGCLEAAKAQGAGMVKFRAWNANKRALAAELGPYSYEYPIWQAYYSVSNPQLKSTMAAESVWDFSPFEIF
jgi:hypothetical protein